MNDEKLTPEKPATAAAPVTAEAVAAAPANEKTAEPKKNPNIDPYEKTTGEKYYGALKFATGEVFILGATAVIAYIARYGPNNNLNVFRKIQDWFEKDLLTKKIPLSKMGETGKLAAGAAASTMVTFHGGNLFAPFMKSFENNKRKMVGYFNDKFGEAGEKEIGEERLKHEPKQTWGDVIKGRLAAWAIVFSSFFTGMVIAGKDQHGMYRLDKYEESFGRWMAGFTKSGKELAKIPAHLPLAPAPHPNKVYRFGRILALDLYATTAGLIIWNAFSKLSAKNRTHQHPESPMNALAPDNALAGPADAQPAEPAEPQRSHAAKARKEESFAGMVTNQRAENTTAQLSAS